MQNKIGSLVSDLVGLAITAEEKEILSHPLIGGVILFSRNYENRAQLTDLCREIRACIKKPLLIMVDQEGGRVQRFKAEFTHLPAMAVFGEIYRTSKTKAAQAAKDCAWLMATELLSCGVDLSLAPVLDLDKGLNVAIGNRAFASDPQIVTELASAFILGMQEAGMACVGKHFPGHGSVMLDSHIALPSDERNMDDIEINDMSTFTELIKRGIPAIMTAHILFPHVDKQSVCYSKFWLETVLRKKLGFSGLILSDDLNMEGANVAANFAERFIAAKEAGCDVVLLCNNRPGTIQVLDKVIYTSYLINEEKWQTLRGVPKFVQPLTEKRWQQTRDFLGTIE